jgi:hypothetical protein
MSLLDQLDEFEKENEQLKLDKIELEKEVAVANAKISTMERIVRETTETRSALAVSRSFGHMKHRTGQSVGT